MLGASLVMSQTLIVDDPPQWTVMPTIDYAKGRTTRNFHKVMDVLLKGMAEGQAGKDCRLKNVPLKLCGRWFLLDIVCPLLFVINDGKQGDQLCCHVNGHHSSICCHHSWSCDCLFDDLDNPEVECSFLPLATVNMSVLQWMWWWAPRVINYKVDNAFNRIQMGQNPHGIFMCAVVDVMHTVQHGVIMYSLESFKKGSAPRHWNCLTRWHFCSTRLCCQTIWSSFPRTDFSRGITNLSMVECSEQSGALFFLAALTMQVQGWHHALAGNKYGDNLEAVFGNNGSHSLLWGMARRVHVLGDWQSVWRGCHGWWCNRCVDEAECEAPSQRQRQRLESLKAAWDQTHRPFYHRLRSTTWLQCLSPQGASQGSRQASWATSTQEFGYNWPAVWPQNCRRNSSSTLCMHFSKNMEGMEPTLNNDKAAESVIPTLENPENELHDDNSNAPTREVGRGMSYVIRSFRDPDDDNRLRCEVIFDTQTTAPIKLEENLTLFEPSLFTGVKWVRTPAHAHQLLRPLNA